MLYIWCAETHFIKEIWAQNWNFAKVLFYLILFQWSNQATSLHIITAKWSWQVQICSLIVSLSSMGKLDIYFPTKFVMLSRCNMSLRSTHINMCNKNCIILSQFHLFRHFPNFSALWINRLVVEYHVYIWQVSPQLSCGDTCQIWMWLR